MYEEQLQKIKGRVLHLLEGLKPNLTYHTIGHTLDVLAQCDRIAAAEGVTHPRELFLLRVAALYHDSGFLNRYRGHEEESCRLFLADANGMGLSVQEKAKVQGLIMATRIPQQPTTLGEQIICDADLDYLGRSDFRKIGDRLRREFIDYGIVADDDEWRDVQLRFLKAHFYHTASSSRLREPVKQKHLLAAEREQEELRIK